MREREIRTDVTHMIINHRLLLTVVGGPSHGLGTVPGGEGVGREARVDQGKVGCVLVVLEIVEELVHLRGRQLALVHNVLVGERTDVEPVLEGDGVGRLLAQHVQLTVEQLVVKGGVDSRVKDHEGLLDRGLLGQGRGSEDRVVHRDLAPAEDLESVLLCNRLESSLLFAEMGLVGAEEDVADGILTLGREGDFEAGGLLNHEGVGDTRHDTGTITVPWVGASGTTMSLKRRKKKKKALFRDQKHKIKEMG